ncbi:hypothetical protein [Pseudomonas phage COT4]|nr:hypothetical protein [Pseudomonas phage COT4]
MAKPEHVTAGGWVWWARKVKQEHPDCTLTIKELLQLYIKGTKWEDVK